MIRSTLSSFSFLIDKLLSPLRLELGTSHKPSPSLYHLSHALKVEVMYRACQYCMSLFGIPRKIRLRLEKI